MDLIKTKVSDQPSVFIIILNWNGWEDSIECLESVLKIDYGNFRIVLLDNGSHDDSIAKIKQWAGGNINTQLLHVPQIDKKLPIKIFEYERSQAENGGMYEIESEIQKAGADQKIVLIKNNENLGFAGGNNVGIRYALQKGADYVFLLNNDTIIQTNGLKPMVNFLENNRNYIAATSQIRYYDRPEIWNCGGDITWYYMRKYLFAEQNILNVPQSGFANISYITGCSMLISANMLKKFGVLSENFFHGEEDFEFALRAKKNKLKMACVFDSVILHKLGKSIKPTIGSNFLGIAFIYYLNRFINVKNYMPKFLWYNWRFISLIYIFLVLNKNGVTFPEFILFAKKLMQYSTKYDRVDRNLFNEFI